MSTINADVKARIFAAAEEINGAGNKPTVDAVRKLAKVNMNDANVGMREWRELQQSRQAAALPALPESLQAAVLASAAQIWQTAQGLANETLRAAQAGWEAERQELLEGSEQLSNAFDQLDMEHEKEKARGREKDAEIERLRRQLGEAQGDVQAAAARVDEMRLQVSQAQGQLTDALATVNHLTAELSKAQEKAEAHGANASLLQGEVVTLRGQLDRLTMALASGRPASTPDDASRPE